MNKTAIERCIHEYFAALQSMQVEAWLATFAADGASHDPAGTPPHVGHAALQQFFEFLTAAFASVTIGADQILVQGSRAAVTWRASGVGQNGRAVQFKGIDVFEINDAGKIQTVWGIWDPRALFAELSA